MKYVLGYLREYFFPFGCSICGEGLAGAGEAWYGLCERCHAGLERELGEIFEGDACGCCGRPLVSEHGLCMSCRQGDGRAYDQARVLFPYAGKYRKLLTAFKFDRNTALGNYFAEKITEAIERCGIPLEAEHEARLCIVPVPPRPGKIRTEGWDQVERLARLLERNKRGGLPVSRCLKRLPSKSQKELGRENRRTNLKGRMVTVRQPPKTALLIDDVMTTGSTLDACAAALKEGGAERVYGLCLFYD